LIPAVLRKALGIKIGDKVNLVVEKDRIKIVPLKISRCPKISRDI
jgi:bifunctional DNA-binding transcriptional regulator/antitoxin component of YhaV-PrlF toxin-antitoxin module